MRLAVARLVLAAMAAVVMIAANARMSLLRMRIRVPFVCAESHTVWCATGESADATS